LKLIEVTSPTLSKLFLEMPLSIYKNDPEYIRPLNKDIEAVFDEEQNKLFKTGSCIRWLLYDADNKLIGRIAAFVNKKYKQSQPTGGFGFFECINNQAAANMLLHTAKKWLQQQGMEAMDGPINFGERDKFWGLLINGFMEPLYGLNYNPPYYQALLENYGLQIYFNQLCYGMSKTDVLNDRFYKYHKQYADDPNFSMRTIELDKLDKYAVDFCKVYNAAFAKHGEGKSMDERLAKGMFKSMKDIIDPKLCYYVYHLQEPIAMWICLPDLNQYFKHFNGRFGIIEKIRVLWMKKFMKNNRFIGLVYGVDPKWSGKGVDTYMIVECSNYVKSTNSYDTYEMQWIGDFNPRMVNLAKNLQAKEVRRLATYRMYFDENIPFKRMPILG
jgi:hypothetical protein